MSATIHTGAKKAALPLASALVLASALALHASQEADFSQLKTPENFRPNAELVSKPTKLTAQTQIDTAQAHPAKEKTNIIERAQTEIHEDGGRNFKFGMLAAGASLVAAGLFALQTLRNGATTKIGWSISTVNESLMGITSYALGSISNAFLPISFAIGSGTALLFAWRFGDKKPFTPTEKISAGVAVVGWLAYACNPHDPIFAAWAGLIGYHAANVPFIQLFYKKPGEITATGQALFFASATLNLFAMSALTMRESLSPIGIFIGITLSSGALALGHLREWRQRRRTPYGSGA